MNEVENRLRKAARAVSDAVPADSAPPLRLPGVANSGFPSRRMIRVRRFLAPLAAAVAMIVIAASSAVVAHRIGQTRQAPPAGTAVGQNGVPPYFVELAWRGQAEMSSYVALVRSSQTGAVLAQIAPPDPFGTFSVVTGAADDHTFVLGARRWLPGRRNQQQNADAPTQFFLLRISPSSPVGPRTTLTRLSFSEPNRSAVYGAALSPDGRKLAVLCWSRHEHVRMQVITISTGQVRTWLRANQVQPGELSWTADSRYVQFNVTATPNGAANSIRLLDTQARGTDLFSDSRTVISDPKIDLNVGFYPAIVTPNGRTVVAVTSRWVRQAGRSSIEVDLSEYSARTGKLVRVLHRHQHVVDLYRIFWASPTGNALILTRSLFTPRNSPAAREICVFRDGHLTLLPQVPLYDITIEGIAW